MEGAAGAAGAVVGAAAFGGDETKVASEAVFDEPVAIEKVFFKVVVEETPLAVLETRVGVDGGVKGTEVKGAFAFPEEEEEVFGLNADDAEGLKEAEAEAAKVNAAAEEETTDMIVQPNKI